VIRPARRTDYDAFARLFLDLGLPQPAPARDRWMTEQLPGTLIDERDGHVDGYVQFHTLGKVGYVRQLVVAPPLRGKRRGAELMLHAAAALRAAGVREWHVHVKTENVPAIRIYEQLGLRAEHRSTALRFPWSRHPELPCAPAAALPVHPNEDDDIERSLGMIGGQIAMARRRPIDVLRQLRAEDCAAVGFASLDPGVAGARIFRVATPAFAGTLLAALRPHVIQDDVALVIDDDDPLTDLLVTHGAMVKLRLLHYSGTLPEVLGM
jgi:N-acetylglutamate synthase-like GNAT family acetyltransferase